jgi:hypothetical protein
MQKIPPQPLRNILFSTGLMVVFAGLIMIVVGLSFRSIVHATLQKEAERKAVLWTQEFMAQVPDHYFPTDTEGAYAAQFGMIRPTFHGEDIFRFSFFSPTGELISTSDEGKIVALGESIHSSAALSVYSSKQNHITVKYGEDVPNAPDTFVEAYIPAISTKGRILGVMEIHIDVSFLASTLAGIVKSFGALVICGSIIAFLVPASILVFRNQRLNSAQARETWLAAILNHAPFEVVIKDADGKIRAISQNVIDEVKMTEKDFIGKTTADFLPANISQQKAYPLCSGGTTC